VIYDLPLPVSSISVERSKTLRYVRDYGARDYNYVTVNSVVCYSWQSKNETKTRLYSKKLCVGDDKQTTGFVLKGF